MLGALLYKKYEQFYLDYNYLNEDKESVVRYINGLHFFSQKVVSLYDLYQVSYAYCRARKVENNQQQSAQNIHR